MLVLLEGASTFFREIPISDFLFDTNWQPLFNPVSYGIWELVAGTMNIVLWSLVIALPLLTVIFIGIGIFGVHFVGVQQLVELAGKRGRRQVRTFHFIGLHFNERQC